MTIFALLRVKTVRTACFGDFSQETEATGLEVERKELGASYQNVETTLEDQQAFYLKNSANWINLTQVLAKIIEEQPARGPFYPE